MDYITLGTIAWFITFVIIGFFRGFWKSLAGFASLFVAYVASVFLAPPFAKLLKEHIAAMPANESIAMLISALALFFSVGFVVRFGVLALGKTMPISPQWLNRSGGVVVSGVYGSALGLVVIWGAAIVWETLAETNRQIPKLKNTPLIEFSRQAVAKVTAWNLKHSGASDSLASFSAAVTQNPQKVVGEFKEVIHSDAFSELASSDELSELAANEDVHGLLDSANFQRLLQDPSVAKVRKSLSSVGAEWNDEQLAELTLKAWKNAESLKNSADYQQLINDPEIKEFMDGKGKLGPDSLAKLQALVTKLLSGDKTWSDENGEENL